jgi:hypothetical protein
MITHVLFAGDSYYPSGGWNDVIEKFESCDEAINAMRASNKEFDWWHLVDLTTDSIVASGRGKINEVKYAGKN